MTDGSLVPDQRIGRFVLKAGSVFISFWLFFLCCYMLSPFVHNILGYLVAVKAEYTIIEQLSKYYLFIIMLSAILAYDNASEPSDVQISIGFLLIGIVMYLSESNMLVERSQPIFALGVFGYTAYLLIKNKAWYTLLLIGSGCFIIFLGVVSDFVSEHEYVRSKLPTLLTAYLNTQYEEIYDVIGIGQICVAVLIHYWDKLEKFIKDNRKWSILLLLNSALITIGNGFLHYQYKPDTALTLSALIMMWLGFSGLVMTNRYLIEHRTKLKIVTESGFYLFIFVFFIMLPVAFGNTKLVESVIFWLPAMVVLGVLLFLKHPSQIHL